MVTLATLCCYVQSFVLAQYTRTKINMMAAMKVASTRGTDDDVRQ